MRYLALLVVLALGAAAAVLPQPDSTQPGPTVGVEEPAVAVCAVEEGSGRTTRISVLSTVDGPARLTLFASGESAGSLGQRTGSSGSIVIPVVDVAAVGTVGGLVEMPVARSAAGSLVVGSNSLSAEACAAIPPPLALLGGGSTLTGETFVMQLMNPYAGEAVAALTVRSENGTEANESFERVIVPPRSSTFVDFSDLIPGRESISVLVETTQGRLMAIGRLGAGGGSAVWRALEPAMDWFMPVPELAATRELIISSSSGGEVDYQVDVYGSEGLDEAALSGVLEPGAQEVIALDEIGAGALGLRVISAAPVVATLRAQNDTGIAMTTGSVDQSSRWFLPGAGRPDGGVANVVLFNTGSEDAEFQIRPLRENSSILTFPVESGGVASLALDTADGYLIESTGPSVVSWSAVRAGAMSTAIGVPILDE